MYTISLFLEFLSQSEGSISYPLAERARCASESNSVGKTPFQFKPFSTTHFYPNSPSRDFFVFFCFSKPIVNRTKFNFNFKTKVNQTEINFNFKTDVNLFKRKSNKERQNRQKKGPLGT